MATVTITYRRRLRQHHVTARTDYPAQLVADICQSQARGRGDIPIGHGENRADIPGPRITHAAITF